MKRKFDQLQDEPMLRIQLAEEAPDKPPLEACSLLLRASCSCARGLPLDSSTWDLSSFLIDGHPVSRDTVTAWLNVVYTLLDNKPFEEGTPASATNATRLYQLLAFTNAVGSRQGVLNACLAGLKELCFEVKTGDQALQLSVGTYSWRTCANGEPIPGELAGVNAQDKQAAVRAVTAQLEQLLYLAYHLQLAPLQEVLHGFTRRACAFSNSLLYGHMEAVLTPRVVQASVDADVAKPALLQVLVGQAAVLGGRGGLLAPAGGPQSSVVQFQATLAQPLPGANPGEVVDVQLDLSGYTLKVDGRAYGLQLVIGPMLSLPGRVQVVLGEAPGAQVPTPAPAAE